MPIILINVLKHFRHSYDESLILNIDSIIGIIILACGLSIFSKDFFGLIY
jgi:hypothetical protein